MAKPAAKKQRTEIAFEKEGVQKGTLTIDGVDLSKDPEKVRKLMELLDLPQGTNATITLVASDVIIR